MHVIVDLLVNLQRIEVDIDVLESLEIFVYVIV